MLINRPFVLALTIVAAGWLAMAAKAAAQPAATAAAPRIRACAILTRDEVRKHVPWNAVADTIPPDETPVGATGTSCQYPSVLIRLLPRGKETGQPIQGATMEPISGVGDEAFFRSNRNRYAELYVRAGRHTLMLQASANGNIDLAKTQVISLARALIAKLL
jgi:hypothetical protein